jgi:hypothetical protein
MAMAAVVEAGVGGPIIMTSQAEGAENEFPDPRVTRLTIEGRPPHVSDLRITLWITIEFELDETEMDESTVIARELLDRVVDALAVSAGQEVRVFHWTERYSTPKGQTVRLRPIGFVEQQAVPFDVIPLISAQLTERHYRALRHLRHGLAHTSPERRFSSLMLAIMILARTFSSPLARTRHCPSCHAVLGGQQPGERERLLNLANVLDGWDAREIDRLWDLRNTVMGHGGRNLTADVAMELLEAGFSAARLAYDCLNACLPGLALQGPAPSWFVTDLYMLLDSGDHAHETAIDVRVGREDDQWIAAWPAVEPAEFRADDPPAALRAARDRAIQSMKRAPRASDGREPEVLRLAIFV